MESEARKHTSPHCREPVHGHLLEPGDVLEPTDVYDSTVGDWQSCPCPGLTLQAGSDAIWVRPLVFKDD